MAEQNGRKKVGFRSPTFAKSRGSWGFWASLALLATPQPALAQIIPDGSLGTQVGGACAGEGGTCNITNGSPRGSNLFHSFQRFSLPKGDIANFQTLPAIQNVIVRVTGQGSDFISNINGTIQTSNPANFFLLNPNGILFGSGAALNIGGSFLATTAERMLFQDGTILSTRDPAPLLTINVPIGLQMGATPGEIRMERSYLSAGETDNFGDFALVGGDVTLDNAIIRAPGQRVFLGGVGENSTAGLLLSKDRLSLNLYPNTLRRDITLTNGVVVNAGASQGNGEVIVVGRNITIDGKSRILTGIFSRIDNAATNQAGDITINAAANLQLTQGSFIVNDVRPNATGQSGNISITATDIQIRDASQIGSYILGNGNAGKIWVTANTVMLDGSASGIASFVDWTSKGNGGDVTIKADSFTISNRAQVGSFIFGNGNAGNVNVQTSSLNMSNRAGITAANYGNGNAGNVAVQTGILSITNGAVINANTGGEGDAGNVQVTANNIALDGIRPDGQGVSGIGTQVLPTGKGRGGNVSVEADSLTVTNGAAISASSFGTGNGGDVWVNASTISLGGTTPDGELSSGIFSTVDNAGAGGNVTVQAGTLTITHGADVSASTFGVGNAGNVRVTANAISLDGIALNGSSSGISSQVGITGQGAGGNVQIATDSFSITHGARVSASTFGVGNAGNVWVTANTVALDGTTPDGLFGSGIFSGVGRTAIGTGGDVTVQSGLLTLTNGARVSASALGKGSAGNLDLTVRNLRLDGGFITAGAFSGDGANINLSIGDLLLMRNGSQISTSAGFAGAGGNGGNITINAPRGFLVTAPNENNDITANAFNGSGGRVNITAQGIYWFTPRSRAELAQLLGTTDPSKLDPRLLPTNDITAISQGNPNLSGTVALNTLGVDPTRSLFSLPGVPLDPRTRMDERCQFGGRFSRSSFVYTGRGGFPSDPFDVLRHEESELQDSDWIVLDEQGRVVRSRESGGEQRREAGGRKQEAGVGSQADPDRDAETPHSPTHPLALPPSPTPSPSHPITLSPPPLIEATGWIQTPDGQVYLVADAPNGGLPGSWLPMLNCQTYRLGQ